MGVQIQCLLLFLVHLLTILAPKFFNSLICRALYFLCMLAVSEITLGVNCNKHNELPKPSMDIVGGKMFLFLALLSAVLS